MLILNTLKGTILKVFDIKESELNKTFLLQLNIFLLITTLLIVKPTINSLFLSELGSDALPLGYVLTAIMAVVGSYFYDRLLEKYSLNKVIERTLIGAIICLVIFGLAFNLNLGKGYFLYVPYVWVAIFGLLTASQFWILANLVYNVREAKRVFGFIGAGAIGGGIFGGYLTSLLTTVIATENLLFIASIVLAGCLPITRYIWKNEVIELNPFQVSLRSKTKGDSPFRLIKQDRLLSLIAIVVGISVLVAKLVDYQYSEYASRLIDDQDDLTSFFGFWFSTLSVISLLIQLFLTQRIVGTFGVGKSLLWLPSGIVVGSMLLLFVPQLWVVVLIKVVDGSLKQSVNKAATELLSIPIPIDKKKKTKTFTDVVVDSIATGLAGFILIFFINGLSIAATYISLIIIVLICIWLYFIYRLREEYVISFKRMLEVSHVKKDRAAKNEIPVTSIVDTVIRVFHNGTEGQILYMLQKTLEVKNERFFFAIESLLSHPSSKVRALAIENLYFLKSANLCFQMETMVYDDDQQVTTAAFRYLVKNYDKDTVELFDRYLNSDDATIANAALIGLSSELRNNPFLQERFSLENRLKKALEHYREIRSSEQAMHKMLAILEAIGNAKVKELYHVIWEQLPSKNIAIAKAAIYSASKTLDKRFIDGIIPFLSIRETRKSAIRALFNFGEPIMDILMVKIQKELVELEDAIHFVAIVERFASQKAVTVLMKLTDDSEHAIKIEAIEALKRIKWHHPNLYIKDRFVVDKILDECNLYQTTLSVIHSQIVIQYKKMDHGPQAIEEQEARNGLIHLLEQRLDRQLQRIFRFLGIKYPPEDIDSIFNTMMNGQEEQRINAIEFLDNILDNQLKKDLIPVAESALLEALSKEQANKLDLTMYSEAECYHALLGRKDVKLKQAVLYLIEKIGDSRFEPLLKMALLDRNEKVRNKAVMILELWGHPVPGKVSKL
tara:strand:+ start:18728 stop:21586 length:2859 start_codon:yes stop_codon:yes gene_type:complete